MAHVASDDVNEKSYILDARKNFEDVSKVNCHAECPDAVCHVARLRRFLLPFRFRGYRAARKKSDGRLNAVTGEKKMSVSISFFDTYTRLTNISVTLLDFRYSCTASCNPVMQSCIAYTYFNESLRRRVLHLF